MFLRVVARVVSVEFGIRFDFDSRGAHETAMVQGSLARPTRFHRCCAPTSASWLSPVEGWFAEITLRQILRHQPLVERLTGCQP